MTEKESVQTETEFRERLKERVAKACTEDAPKCYEQRHVDVIADLFNLAFELATMNLSHEEKERIFNEDAAVATVKPFEQKEQEPEEDLTVSEAVTQQIMQVLDEDDNHDNV